MITFCRYFLYFIIYSFLGWLLEVTCKFIEKKKFINRGFLLGPICPIYGHGILLIIFLIGENTDDLLAVFLKSILVCSVLEYFTSYFMEKLFKARWWDYSKRRFNLNGRICLETMIPFGIMGTIIIYVIHPLVIDFINLFSDMVLVFLAVFFFVLYLIDNIITYMVMNKIKFVINKQTISKKGFVFKKSDNTEFIHKKVMEWIDTNSYLYRHIKLAFPKFKIDGRFLKR